MDILNWAGVGLTVLCILALFLVVLATLYTWGGPLLASVGAALVMAAAVRKASS